MTLQVQKKFTMLSTKEWMQYLQYKLSSEREKELKEQMEYDPFLKEALEAIDNMEGRHLAFQSLNYIHQQIYESTGVSESKITPSTTAKSGETTEFPTKLILIILGALLLLGLIVGGIYWGYQSGFKLFDNQSSDEENTETPTAQSALENQTATTDTASVIVPITTPVTSSMTPTSPTSPTGSSTLPNNTPATPATSTTPATPSSTGEQSTSAQPSLGANNERAMFEQAQQLYKENKIEESKAILRKLNSYNNPYKNQANSILENISGQ